MQTQRTFIEDLKHQYKYGGMYIRLIFINTIVFLALNILLVFGRLMGAEPSVAYYLGKIFALSTDGMEFITHPWGLFTSIFAHFGLWHFIFNMVFLYFAGRHFERVFNQKRLLYTYLLGGIAGGLLELIAHLVFPALHGTSSVIVGASGSIMAIFIAIAFYQPKLTINLFGILPIRIIIIAVIFFVSDFLSLGRADGVAHFAHLGGALLGMISIQNLHSSRNIINWAHRWGDAIIRMFSRKSQPKMKVKKGGNVRFVTDEEYNASAKERQEMTDRILDKISKSGYESLTKKEKDFLFNQSKNG